MGYCVPVLRTLENNNAVSKRSALASVSGPTLCFISAAMQNKITFISENFSLFVCASVALLFIVLCFI